MSAPHILCTIPSERSELASCIIQAGGIPVIDITLGDRVPIPAGAWVRSRIRRAVPGKGPVILAGESHKLPIPKRETWLETSRYRKTPKGFAGIILRGPNVGGKASSKDVWERLSKREEGQRIIIDSGLLPSDMNKAKENNIDGLVVHEYLYSMPEMLLPSTWNKLIEKQDPSFCQSTTNAIVFAPLLSIGVERVSQEKNWWKICEGWMNTPDPAQCPAPLGAAILHAPTLAQQYGSITKLLYAYHNRTQTVQAPLPPKTPTNALPRVSMASNTSPKEIPPSVKKTSISHVIPSSTQEEIAIIGMGCCFPDAQSPEEFWNNIINKRSSITEVPKDRWDPKLFWDPDPQKEDKTYSKVGGFIKDFHFDPKSFRIPPFMLAQIDIVQQMTLASTAYALKDAGYDTKTFDRSRTAVILGNSMGGEVSQDYTLRTRLPELEQALLRDPAIQNLDEQSKQALLERVRSDIKSTLPALNSDSMPGELSNVIAGRVANAFDFNGPNYTLDAACASSMAAIQASVKGLRDREFDMVVTGGADHSMGVPTYVKFSKIGALSPTHSSPFDQRANGFVMGEGCGIILLKRLSDAKRDGDKIYAVISGMGASSDGKGKGITAPNPAGQRFALERAYQNAQFNPEDVDFVECHGTSTIVGDQVELETLRDIQPSTRSTPLRVGSVKSNIGHLKSAAAAASVIKTALAIYHKKFPPTANYLQPRTDIALGVLKIQTEEEDWNSEERLAGVSAFGFGGTNFHLCMRSVPTTPNPAKDVRAQSNPELGTTTSKPATHTNIPKEEFPQIWSVGADSMDILIQKTQNNTFDSPAKSKFVATAFARSKEERTEQCEKIKSTHESQKNLMLLRGRGIYVFDKREDAGKIAFLFTGQGSQYLNMGKELCALFPVVRATFEEANEFLAGQLDKPFLDYIYRDPKLPEPQQFQELSDTKIAQPATLCMDVALFRLLKEHGIVPDMVAGHSLGEYAAAVAAGIMSFQDALIAVTVRGREMASIHLDDPGMMAGVFTSPDNIAPLIAQSTEYVIAANNNSPQQTVIAGSSAGVEKVLSLCQEKGYRSKILPVSHAFHSQIVAPATEPLRAVLNKLDIATAQIPITTNVQGSWFPEEREQIINVLTAQVTSPVEWITQIETMYEAGARIFVECGPQRALTGMVSHIIKNRPHHIFNTNHPKTGEYDSFMQCIAGIRGLCDQSAPQPKVESTPAPPPSSLSHKDLNEILDKRFAQFLQTLQHNAPLAQPTTTSSVVCSGASVGLPGGKEVFAENNIESLLRGENRISSTTEQDKQSFLGKNILRISKNAQTGQGAFQKVESTDQVIQLAGKKSAFDLKAYDVPSELLQSLDITTQLAFAAGLEALKDAHIPLIPRYRNDKQHIGWMLPEPLQEGTGVIFASAFPGYSNLIDNIKHPPAEFDRKFLFRVLSMGHAQFAQYISAKGPNTSVNAACASTTQAIAMAQDWILSKRAERVIVIAADDVTNEQLFEWIGSGFLSVGAATTEKEIADAAIPFDARRNGMILGMGAVGMVLEEKAAVESRGQQPIAELLGSHFSNSAFHGTRLNEDDIAHHLSSFVGKICTQHKLNPAEIAAQTLFVSHETYTPARGGSAAAEINGLRKTFGTAVENVVICNSKGITGHPMGAGIEDVLAVKALEHKKIPPIPNLQNPDPAFGNLRFSKGGEFHGQYALRLAAGFGSQLAFLFWKGTLKTPQGKISEETRYQQWIHNQIGQPSRLVVHKRGLRLIPSDALSIINEKTPQHPEEKKSPAESLETKHTSAPSQAFVMPQDIEERVLNCVAQKTGYTRKDLELDYELEADLGIDTVKQAEIFAALRDEFSIPPQTDLILSEVPTIRALCDWFRNTTQPQQTKKPQQEVVPTTSPESLAPPVISSPPQDIEERVLNCVAEKTGYTRKDLELDYELEADLGIDTVKQAEIFAALRDEFSIPPQTDLILSEVPTIRALCDWFVSFLSDNAPAEKPHDAQESTEKEIMSQEGVALPNPREENPIAQQEIPPAVLDRTREIPLEEDLSIQLLPDPTKTKKRSFSALLQNNPEVAVSLPSLTPVAEAPPEKEQETLLEPKEPEEESTKQPSPKEILYTHIPLPDSTKIYKIVRVPSPITSQKIHLYRSFAILGKNELVEALSLHLRQQGLVEDQNPDIVIDISTSAETGFLSAKMIAPPKRWLCITELGSNSIHLPQESKLQAGARAGLCKTIGKEWPQTDIRVVDISTQYTIMQKVECIVQEIQCIDVVEEVFWHANIRSRIELQPQQTPSITQTSSKVPLNLIITGGTRGISAEIARAFARQYQLNIALLAKTPPGTETFDPEKKKAELRETLQQTHTTVTPTMIREAMSPFETAEEARQTIEDLKILGATVSFYSVDLSNKMALQQVIEMIVGSWGHIDLCIHGAGIEKSKSISDKTLQDFRSVFTPKAIGGIHLLQLLPPKTKFISMGSIAGRFGNAGQIDYAAANDALARLCIGHPQALHIDWSAWDNIGMASRGGMSFALQKRGVRLLEPQPCAELVVALYQENWQNEIVITDQLGGFDRASAEPFLDRVQIWGDHLRCFVELDLNNAPWLADHAINNRPVLPGVMGLEIMVNAAKHMWPGTRFCGASSVEFATPIKLFENIALEVRAKPERTGVVSCVLLSHRTLANGQNKETEHFRAVIQLSPKPSIEDMPQRYGTDHIITKKEIYNRFFHGPSFQVLHQVYELSTDYLNCDGAVFHKKIHHSELSTAPLVLEAAFQAAGLHLMSQSDTMALPIGFADLELLEAPEDGEPLKISVYQEGNRYHVDIDTASMVVLRVRGIKFSSLGPLPEGDRIPKPNGGWTDSIVVHKEASVPDELGSFEITQNIRAQDKQLGRMAVAKLLLSRNIPASSVANDELGAPYLTEHPQYAISIAHKNSQGFAVLSTHGPIGIDVDVMEERPISFVRHCFSPSEQQQATNAQHTTAIWCAKEAVSKLLGVGLRVATTDIEITLVSPFHATVQLHHQAHAIARERNLDHICVKFSYRNQLCFALAHIAIGHSHQILDTNYTEDDVQQLCTHPIPYLQIG